MKEHIIYLEELTSITLKDAGVGMVNVLWKTFGHLDISIKN